jgi:hypothetical protein
MVLVLNDGSKLEMRSVPNFRAVEAWIGEHRKGGAPGKGTAGRSGKPSAGFAPEERASA